MNNLKTVAELDKGDLYLKFDIVFPKKLSENHKNTLISILREHSE
jgi:DnaJ-class molecular chaperone